MSWIFAALLVQNAGPEDVVRLTREGKPEAEVLRAIGAATFKLSADEVVSLRKAGVADAVLSRMIAGPSEILAENRAHAELRIRVNGRTIEIGAGEALAPGASLRLPGTGEFDVTVDGRPRAARVRTPATLTFRGRDHGDFEVITLYVDDAAGSDTCLVRSRITEVVEREVVVPLPVAVPAPLPRPRRVRPWPIGFRFCW
jgi:hypothetical protein